VIRRIFKDLGELKLVSNWFENASDLQFTYDVVTSLVLFLLIYLFYHKIVKRPIAEVDESGLHAGPTAQFVFLKKGLALVLVPVLVGLAVYSFSTWVAIVVDNQLSGMAALSNINTIFFDDFFTILIIVDVLLLLASFYYSDHFHTIIRNSGFVLSTILIKLSFSVSGILNNALIIGSVLFGLLILYIHQLYERAYPTSC
jgi:F0F1-type ATP synthase membrane subunit c/vacuolar-type H+-ATPase subunit K